MVQVDENGCLRPGMVNSIELVTRIRGLFPRCAGSRW